MRFLVSVLCVLALSLLCAHASDLIVTVVDPQSNPVPGAEVQLLPAQGSTPIVVRNTSAEGQAQLRMAGTERYRIQVLAPGFAPCLSDLETAESSVRVRLRLATVSQTVVVTATRTAAVSETSGAVTETLSGAQIQAENPTAASEALRFLPGTVVATTGQRGNLASLFVRGGDSRYNKVIVDGVPINEPGGTFNFGVLPLDETDRMEFVRGAQSTLYGSDAMSSVIQYWSRSGTTSVPELRFGADGGTFGTVNGYASLAGAHGRFDYDLFGDQFNTEGNGPNDQYFNSSEGANLGAALTDNAALRFRIRHFNSRTGVQGEWDFNGDPLIPPDHDQRAWQNDLLASPELSLGGPSRWQHRFTAFEYNHHRANIDNIMDPGRVSPAFGNIDFPFHDLTDINRAGFDYQGDYAERSWAQTTVGYEFEDENGFVGDLDSPPLSHGLRLNHAVYGQQFLGLGRLSIIAGARFVHNGSFGNIGVPRVALTFLALRGGQILSGTRLRFSYATGIKEPRLEESFASGPFELPNPNLKAEKNRAFETGVEQSFLGGKYSLTATYYNNLFRDQIDFATNPVTFVGQYVNVDRSIAHGAEAVLHGRPFARLSIDAGYNYTSTQILQAPFAFDPLVAAGQPLLRRPKHSGSLLLTYLGSRWGGNLGGSFIGRRVDSDFLGFGINHAAGYARVDVGGWYALTSRITAYANLENALNAQYNEVVGYPALGITVRAGMRFRIGGE